MTLRIFEVSTDGTATPVPRDGDRRESAPPPPTLPPTLPPPSGPERWTGSAEWDKLRARLKEQEPQVEPPRRRR
jgi:hypothetical protein